MSNVRKIIVYVLAGLCCFYLTVGLIVLPLTLKWAIEHKGTELLKRPVSAGAVFFNPFLWQLTIKNFQIRGNQKKTMVGFEQCRIDVSFLSLLKKTYRIESFYLDGLTISAVLLPDGHFNLMDLVPADAAPQGEAPVKDRGAAAPATPAPATNSAAPVSPGPLVIVDKIVIERGQAEFIDQTVQPVFYTRIDAIRFNVSGLSTQPDSQVKAVFQARWDEKGTIDSQATVKPFTQPMQLDASLNLNNYLLTVASPYTGKYTARTVKDGKLDFSTVYRITDNKITASHKILIQRFGFGDKVDSKDALNLPFGLALALLEDPHGRITISLPVNGDMSDPQFHYLHLIGQVAKNFFVKLMTKPFAILGSVLGSEAATEDLGYVRFLPGDSSLTGEEEKKLDVLVKGLWEHPKLSLTVNGAYDGEIDWKAVKTEAFTKDYEMLKKESNESETWLLQHLYQRRFGIRALWALSRVFKSGIGSYDEPKLNQEIRRQMIEDAPVDRAAVELLAMERAQRVYDYIVASGFDKARVGIGLPLPVQSTAGQVPLEMVLTTVE